VFCGEEMNVFLRKYAYCFDLKEKTFDLEKIRFAAQKLVGVHDFTGFCTKVPKNKSAVREIFSVKIKSSDTVKGLLSIEFCGNGFLYNQVRIMMGTLLEIASGERNPDDIDKIIETKDRGSAGFTAPPYGLMLYSVEY
jgi:tRNA pseudouridine38-40 synthase